MSDVTKAVASAPILIAAYRTNRIRAEQTRLLIHNCPVGVISAALVSLLLAATLRGSAPLAWAYAYGWSAMVGVCAIAHCLFCWRYRRVSPADASWRRWIAAFSLIAFLEGIVWCIGAIWLTVPGDFSSQLVLLLSFVGVVSGGVVVFGAYLPTYLVFLFPALLPHLFLIGGFEGGPRGLVAGLIALYLVAMPLIAWRFNVQLVEGLRLRFDNADLAADLGRRTSEAEEANLAKSRFLAAASHDLRQPIHALGLFLGALRDRAMDAEARRLVDHIDESVAAMDGLFASLLDISKLDAGVVEAHFEAIAIAPLIDRLCRDYAEEAASKGITLRAVTRADVVRTDPILLERVLRNLVSNAVRYTDAGGVLIGCRRRGEGLSIEIWDTGRGIPPAEQSLIFHEFHQVGNPERDRTKGLGLGLAIVKRVAELIDADLTLDSVPGRGSVFRVRVVIRRGAALAPSAEPEQMAPTARVGLIVVIDDEVPIQQAMGSLLESWGHRVLIAGSVGELFVGGIAGGPRPDLIISDFRLREDDDGIAAIRAVWQIHGADIPAMLITGDTAPDRIAEAQAGGFLLLHKPLSNAKLRAAIGNMLRRVDA